MKLKILFLPKYNIDGASSRYRTYQYIPLFRHKGISCTIFPFYPEGYVKNLYGKKWKNKILFPFCMVKRLLVIMISFSYDLVVIEKEAIPYFPPLVERLLSFLGKKFILDYDDAVYCFYTQSSNKIVRKLFSSKMPKIMNLASGIITGGPELTTYAKQYNTQVYEIPTSIDLDKYEINNNIKETEKFIIGWIGGYASSSYLKIMEKGLKRFLNDFENVEVHLVGYNGNIQENDKIKIIKWTSETEVYELNSMDIGIMPLIDTPFEHGKCGFKLIQYMACGKPTISTPFETNIKIDGGNGNLFANTNDEWYNCFVEAYNNREIFRKIGELNRKIVSEKYSIQANVNKYVEIYKFIRNLK